MIRILSNLVARLHEKKARYLVDLIQPFLDKKEKIMDLGCGSGELTKKISDLGYQILAVDVVDKVKVPGVKVTLYDGKHLPFADKEFDKTLLITVLHHVAHYKELLREAARVSNEIIVVEDIYENWWDRLNIWFWDSVLNLEFFGHPHNNKSDLEWKEIFQEMGFELKGERGGSIREIGYAFKQKAYRLLLG